MILKRFQHVYDYCRNSKFTKRNKKTNVAKAELVESMEGLQFPPPSLSAHLWMPHSVLRNESSNNFQKVMPNHCPEKDYILRANKKRRPNN